MSVPRCAVCGKKRPVTKGYTHRCSGVKRARNVKRPSVEQAHKGMAVMVTSDGRRFTSLDERKQVALALRAGGNTLDEIGAYLGGISRERVRQIVGVPRPRATADPARIVRALRDPSTMNLYVLARRSGASFPSVSRCLREIGLMSAALRLLRWRGRAAYEARRVERIARVRAPIDAFVARHKRFPTATECNDRVEGLPHASTIQAAWGGYNVAAKAFGFRPRLSRCSYGE